MIYVKNLHKSFGKNEVLKGIDEHIAKGEVVVIEENFGVRVTEVLDKSLEEPKEEK